jgi:hypothetical protein
MEIRKHEALLEYFECLFYRDSVKMTNYRTVCYDMNRRYFEQAKRVKQSIPLQTRLYFAALHPQ